MPFDETFRRSVVGLSLIGGVCSAAFSVAATGWRYLKARGGSVTGIPDLPGLTDGRPVAGTAAAVASGLPGSDGRPGVGLGVGLPDLAAPAGPLGAAGLGAGEDRARLLHILSTALTTQRPAASPEPQLARNPAHKENVMSWLSTIKNNLLHVIDGFTPTNDQALVHNAINDLGASLSAFGLAMEGLAENVLTDAVASKLGPNAAKVEYDFLHALVLKANARMGLIAQPTPVPISVPPVSAPPAPVEPVAPVQ